MCQIWKRIHCHFWQSLSTHHCHSWQLQNVPDLETVTLPLLAITEHTPLPFLATPECTRFGNRYIATFGNHLCHSWQLQNVPDLETVSLPLLAITEHTPLQLQNVPDLETATLPLLAITEHTCIFAIIGHYKMSQIWTHLYIASFGIS